MTRTRPSVCAEPGCPEITSDTRCTEHRRARQRESRKQYTRNTYGPRWDAISRRYRRAHPICETPGCTRPSAEVDHAVAVVHFHGDLAAAHDESNLVALCKPCHSRKTVLVDGGLGREPRGVGYPL